MSEFIDVMQSALEFVGGSPGIAALYLAGLLALWYLKYNEQVESGGLFWYATIALIMVINPGVIQLEAILFPQLSASATLLWILPVVQVLLLTGIEAYPFRKGKKEKTLFLLGVCVMLVLAGTTAYNGDAPHWLENSEYIPSDELEILIEIEAYRCQEQEDTVLLWADKDITSYARVYSGNIYQLYGKDLWLGPVDMQLHQIYEDWQAEAYRMMQDPETDLTELAQLAELYQCDVLVFSKEVFCESPYFATDYLGETSYLRYLTTEKYVMYILDVNQEVNHEK